MMRTRPFEQVISSRDHSCAELVTSCMATRVVFEWGRAVCVQFNNVQEGILHGGFEQDMIPGLVFLFPEKDLQALRSEEVVVGDIVLFKELVDGGWDPVGLTRAEIVLDHHNLSVNLRGEDITFRSVFPTLGFLNEFLNSLGEDEAKN